MVAWHFWMKGWFQSRSTLSHCIQQAWAFTPLLIKHGKGNPPIRSWLMRIWISVARLCRKIATIKWEELPASFSTWLQKSGILISKTADRPSWSRKFGDQIIGDGWFLWKGLQLDVPWDSFQEKSSFYVQQHHLMCQSGSAGHRPSCFAGFLDQDIWTGSRSTRKDAVTLLIWSDPPSKSFG